MHRIKEVEMVDSMPNFEVLDAKIASALNKIIPNSHFKRRLSLESYLPTSKRCWSDEDLKSAVVVGLPHNSLKSLPHTDD